MATQFDNNVVTMVGTIAADLEFSHKTFNESFYKTFISISRLNKETCDVIPLTISERLVDINSIGEGTRVYIKGQFRSFNKYDPEKQKRSLILSVFVKDIINVSAIDSENMSDIEKEETLRYCSKDVNEIELDGFACKKPIYRKTPLGREITDLLIAVNRYKKAYYIPCITWGRNARFCENIEVGTELNITGRIQSRTYRKKLGEDEYAEPKVVYEVSVISVGVVSNYDGESYDEAPAEYVDRDVNEY